MYQVQLQAQAPAETKGEICNSASWGEMSPRIGPPFQHSDVAVVGRPHLSLPFLVAVMGWPPFQEILRLTNGRCPAQMQLAQRKGRDDLDLLTDRRFPSRECCPGLSTGSAQTVDFVPGAMKGVELLFGGWVTIVVGHCVKAQHLSCFT